MKSLLLSVLFNAVILGIMAETCTDETEKDLLEVALNLAKENPNAPVVKDILTAKHERIKVMIASQVDSYVVFQVTFGKQSFAVKKLKKGKESDFLAKEYLSIEAKGLILRQQLFLAQTPVMYCWSEKLNCLALQDLTSFVSLRTTLASGMFDKSTIHRVADSIAQMHKSIYVNSQPDLLKDLYDFAYEFNNSPSFDVLSDLIRFDIESLEDGDFKNAIIRLKNSNEVKSLTVSLMETAQNSQEALLHGRLVGDSILVRGDEIKLASDQYLFVGPCAFDVGFLLAEYLYTYYDHMLTPENNDWHRNISYQMIDAAKESVQRYLAIMGGFIHVTARQNDFISDVAAFCGVQLVNRALSTPDISKALEILEAGARLQSASKTIHDAGQLVVIALMLAS